MQQTRFLKDLTDHQKVNILNLYKQSWNMQTVSDELNISVWTVNKYLKNNFKEIVAQSKFNQPQKYKKHRKYKFDEGFFETIDTEEKAYFLGLLYADGYIHEKSYRTVLQLKETDIDIINTFKKCLNLSNNLLYINGQCRLVISSKKIVQDLNKHGCGQAKSFTLKFPELSDNMYSHFIRGYFDGDGCICLTSRNKGACLNIVSSIDFINSLSEFLKLKGMNKIYIREHTKCKQIRYLVMSSKVEIKNFENYIYKDSAVYLDRKKNKFENVFRKTLIDKDKVKESYSRHGNLNGVTAELGISTMSAYRIIKDMDSSLMPCRDLSDELKNNIKKDITSGLKRGYIMSHYKISSSSYHRIKQSLKNDI